MRYYTCCCARCRIRSVVGPLILITVGVLFALDQIWTRWSFSQTWPLILIVLGLVKLAERLASDEGHGLPPAAAANRPRGEDLHAP